MTDGRFECVSGCLYLEHDQTHTVLPPPNGGLRVGPVLEVAAPGSAYEIPSRYAGGSPACVSPLRHARLAANLQVTFTSRARGAPRIGRWSLGRTQAPTTGHARRPGRRTHATRHAGPGVGDAAGAETLHPRTPTPHAAAAQDEARRTTPGAAKAKGRDKRAAPRRGAGSGQGSSRAEGPGAS